MESLFVFGFFPLREGNGYMLRVFHRDQITKPICREELSNVSRATHETKRFPLQSLSVYYCFVENRRRFQFHFV